MEDMFTCYLIYFLSKVITKDKNVHFVIILPAKWKSEKSEKVII